MRGVREVILTHGTHARLRSLAKAIVGVAGGATRAAITVHQARRNNTAGQAPPFTCVTVAHVLPFEQTSRPRMAVRRQRYLWWAWY